MFRLVPRSCFDLPRSNLQEIASQVMWTSKFLVNLIVLTYVLSIFALAADLDAAV